jgi:alginate O-acetyltransferase complex protein AlgI
MVFTSPTFLFLFLPIVLLAFLATPRSLRTPLLVAVSCVFYAWGEKQLVLLIIASSVINWALALAVQRSEAPLARRMVLTAAVLINIGALLYFKYTNFIIANLNALVEYSGIHVAFYISFFPHLIAGPILRFNDISAPLPGPSVTLARFDLGVSRFINGLCKKMLLANTLGYVADQVFQLPAQDLGTAAAWLGVICYALQIYFDFSGYSDMAIGLGHMVGFSLPENFRLPYRAESVKDFWRRWHISLSSWFRDYLFVPLGGSRVTAAATYRNLLVVFLLCGLWHGASWTFIVWGAYHGVFLVLERTRVGSVIARWPLGIRRSYALLVVLIGWVFFRAETLPAALHYLAAMGGLAGARPVPMIHFLTTEAALALIVGSLLATRPFFGDRLDVLAQRRPAGLGLSLVSLQLVLFALSLLYVAAGTYNPFIYFRF